MIDNAYGNNPKTVGARAGTPLPLIAAASLCLWIWSGVSVWVPGTALAHTGQPRHTWQVQAGPYTLKIELYADPVVGQPLPIRIIPLNEQGTGPATQSPDITVRLVPGLGTDATPVRAGVLPDPDKPGAYATQPSPSVVGAWVIEISATGPRGQGTGAVPITVAGPRAIPVWVGWLIGLAPMLGVAWFAWWQWRWMRRRVQNGPASPQPQP